MKTKKFDTKQLALAAILTALVAVLQFASRIEIIPGVSITFVLVPVVIGAALLGKWIGTWLGLVFGVSVLLMGDAEFFLAINPAGTIITVIIKGCCAGLAAGLTYELLEKRNQYVAVFAASIICPVVNTGIFLIGCRLFFWNEMRALIVSVVLVNFLIELGINMLLAPTILRLINLAKRNK